MVLYPMSNLEAWEIQFRKGQLTLWILLALASDALTADELASEISAFTGGLHDFNVQSIYRALRSFVQKGFVSYVEVPSDLGPVTKKYSLEKPGRDLLAKFIERNIEIFNSDQFKKLLEKV